MTMQAITLSVSIERNWRDLYDAIWRPEAFTRWASGLAQSTLLKHGEHNEHGDHWRAHGPSGDVTIRFTPHNAFGVMDHTVHLENGDEVFVPLRVMPNGEGAEVALTLFRQKDMSDERFAEDVDWVKRDLARLAERFGG